MKVRMSCSFLSLADSMLTVKEVNSMEELKEKMEKDFPGYYKTDTIKFEDYCYDERIDWHTYLICADRTDGSYTGCAVYFSDGKFDD